MENTEIKNSQEIINKFMLYAYNFNVVYVNGFYVPECIKATNNPEHIASKFINNRGTQGFLNMWHQLDTENQIQVTDWIMNNYKG